MVIVVRKLILYILLTSSVTALASCEKNNPKNEIRQALAELVSAVENKKHRTVTLKLTKNFLGNNRLNQQTMSALVFRYYLRHKFIKIYTLVNSIEILDHEIDKTARAKMEFHAALTSTKSILPEHMRVFKITAYWVKQGDNWKMSKAHWLEVRPQTVYPKLKDQIANNNIMHSHAGAWERVTLLTMARADSLDTRLREYDE